MKIVDRYVELPRSEAVLAAMRSDLTHARARLEASAAGLEKPPASAAELLGERLCGCLSHLELCAVNDYDRATRQLGAWREAHRHGRSVVVGSRLAAALEAHGIEVPAPNLPFQAGLLDCYARHLQRQLAELADICRAVEVRLLARLGEVAATDAIPRASANDDRDRFIYEARAAGKTLKQMLALLREHPSWEPISSNLTLQVPAGMLREHPSWEPISSESGLRKACHAYAERKQLPAHTGKRGRPSKKTH
jgi:hypothetical protein